MPEADASPAARRTVSPRAVLLVVAFGVFIAADDLTVVTTMLRPIIGDLGIVLPDGIDDAAWIVNAYLIAYIAVMPFMGRLSDILGRRRVYLAALSLFLTGSIIIPLSNTLGPFLFGRVLTALGGGALVPIGMAAVSDAYPARQRARSLGVLGAVDTLGWVWGPLYGAMIIRFLAWRWQFYFNIPLAVIGMIAAWIVLDDHTASDRETKIDWAGAALLTAALIALNLALLGSAEIQSVTGLEELTGSGDRWLAWLYPLALIATVGFVLRERRTAHPLIDPALFRGRNLVSAVAVNFIVGATLVIAMVDVPLFINVVELDLEHAAVITGWVLSALTASMSLTSYIGGRITESRWYRPPVLLGMGAAAAAFFVMGFGWNVTTDYRWMAVQLAVLGAGFGLVMAPTTTAVVDAAPPDRRGTAASLVLVLRLIGLSVGLSALTAWGLYRFNQLRDQITLPPLDDPGYAEAVKSASARLTTSALAETFVAAGVLVLIGAGIAMLLRRGPHQTRNRETDAVSPGNQEETPMKGFTNRNLAVILGAGGTLVVLLVIANLVLFTRMADAADARDQLAADLARVEGGAAIYAAQVTAFQQQLSDLAPTIDTTLEDAIGGIEQFRNSTISFDVPIDEVIPVDASVTLDRTLRVPIDTTLPIDQTIDTRITITGPFGVDIPLDITVPLQLELPINLDVAIPVNETIPIATEVPVRLDVPIAINVGDTELATLAESLQHGLESFRALVDGIGG
jgi:EmrB/QacA subfamily drug resistance transporter